MSTDRQPPGPTEPLEGDIIPPRSGSSRTGRADNPRTIFFEWRSDGGPGLRLSRYSKLKIGLFLILAAALALALVLTFASLFVVAAVVSAMLAALALAAAWLRSIFAGRPGR